MEIATGFMNYDQDCGGGYDIGEGKGEQVGKHGEGLRLGVRSLTSEGHVCSLVVTRSCDEWTDEQAASGLTSRWLCW